MTSSLETIGSLIYKYFLKITNLNDVFLLNLTKEKFESFFPQNITQEQVYSDFRRTKLNYNSDFEAIAIAGLQVSLYSAARLNTSEMDGYDISFSNDLKKFYKITNIDDIFNPEHLDIGKSRQEQLWKRIKQIFSEQMRYLILPKPHSLAYRYIQFPQKQYFFLNSNFHYCYSTLIRDFSIEYGIPQTIESIKNRVNGFVSKRYLNNEILTIDDTLTLQIDFTSFYANTIYLYLYTHQPIITNSNKPDENEDDLDEESELIMIKENKNDSGSISSLQLLCNISPIQEYLVQETMYWSYLCFSYDDEFDAFIDVNKLIGKTDKIYLIISDEQNHYFEKYKKNCFDFKKIMDQDRNVIILPNYIHLYCFDFYSENNDELFDYVFSFLSNKNPKLNILGGIQVKKGNSWYYLSGCEPVRFSNGKKILTDNLKINFRNYIDGFEIPVIDSNEYETKLQELKSGSHYSWANFDGLEVHTSSSSDNDYWSKLTSLTYKTEMQLIRRLHYGR